MRRRTLLVLAGLCSFSVLLILAFVIQSERRVEIGMHTTEVEAIMGGPGLRLEFRNDEELNEFARALTMQAPPNAVMRRWDRKHSSIHVLFNSDGTVAGVYYPRGSSRYVNMILRSVGLD